MVLESCADAVADPLLRIYQESFDPGIIPNDCKTAQITPIFKKGYRSDPSNYRPISHTSICCKLIESFIRQTLTAFLEENSFISKNSMPLLEVDHVSRIFWNALRAEQGPWMRTEYITRLVLML
jgi:hypothetical protein